jgi:hypothetical protein
METTTITAARYVGTGIEQGLCDQCYGSVTFWYGSGSSDPYLSPTDPDADPDPAQFVSDLQDTNHIIFSLSFNAHFCFNSTFTSFFKDKNS